MRVIRWRRMTVFARSRVMVTALVSNVLSRQRSTPMNTSAMICFAGLTFVATGFSSVYGAETSADVPESAVERQRDTMVAGAQSRTESINCSSDTIDCFFESNQGKPECAVQATGVRSRSTQLQRLSAPGP